MDEQEHVTVSEDDLYEKEEITEETVHLVTFRLSNEWYGVDIGKVKEVAKIEKWASLPSSPAHIRGIINLRGNILSVTDLKIIFGLEHEGLTGKSRLVIIEDGMLATGLLADEVDKIREVPASKIDPTLTTIEPQRAEYLFGECRLDDKLIGILNAEAVLDKTRNK